MTATNGAVTSKKRRQRPRRRRQDKPAVSGKLVLDDGIKGDVGFVSEDLFRELFPHASDSSDNAVHIALAPWTPQATPTDTPWSIVPVTCSPNATSPSTVYFSPSSSSLQRFAVALQQLAPSKLVGHSRSGIEVLVLDAAPLQLDTVYVSLENELVRRLEAGEGTFYRNHPTTNGRGKAGSAEERLTTALREALGGLKVVHAEDLFPLPLPPHPVTHVPPSPGKIVLCEPVAQGVLSNTTKIILMRGKARGPGRGGPPAIRHGRGLSNGAVRERDDEDDEGATTDQFYSAAEDRDKFSTTTATETDFTETETEMSATDFGEDDDSLSDDSMDDMISLQAPALHATSTSAVSTMGPGTPRTIGTIRGRKTNGATTPGSVFSNFTSATARPDRPRGRLFKAQGLLRSMPADLLHPKPGSEEDDEARIYVHVSSLPKIGCFSGDWVRIEVAQEPPANGLGAFGLGSFAGFDSAIEANWRPVRVYGLPEGYTPKQMARLPSSKQGERRLSFFESQVQRPASPTAYASPILLANLDDAPYLRISPLKKAQYAGKGTLPRFTSASRPPYARDISIHHIRTPVSAERAFQTAVLGGLKHYFAPKIRLVRTGDLIAVPVDAQLGRALQEGPGTGGSEVDDVMALTAGSSSDPPSVDSVAWFKVGHIQIHKADEDENNTAEAFWGNVACIDSASVGMHGSGFEASRIPGTKQNTWQYYLGLKKAPKKDAEGPLLPLQVSDPQQQYVSPLRHQMRQLLAAATSKRAIHLKMPPVAILLTSTHRNIGKATLAGQACSDIGLHTYNIDAFDIISEGGGSGSDVKTEGFLRTRAERAMSCGPDCCALLVRHVDALTADRIESTLKDIVDETRVLIATTNDVDKVPDGVRALFTHEMEMGAPDEAERESILRTILDDRGVSLEPSIDLNAIALKTAALVAGDLVDVVDRASAAQQSRLEALVSSPAAAAAGATVRDVQLAGGPTARSLTKADLDAAVEAARKSFSDSIGAPKIPNVTWDDVGGLGNVKDAITETIQLPLERPELFARGMKKRSGILFYGPPGTGKTLLAKAIATEYSLNFFSVKGPELLNMYIGESEANVRRVFQRARDARPCVVFFDELDSVAPKRGNQGDSGGVMDRIVSQLLAELDGMSGSDAGAAAGGVFVIGATNRPDLLDPALLRPGRFDKMLYLGVSDTHEKQLTILQALTRKFTLDPSLSLPAVASRLPLTYTGADFYALCSDAMLKAVTRQANLVDARVRQLSSASQMQMSTAYFFDHHATPQDLAVVVTERDFDEANVELVPSVSQGELEHYERVRATFEGGKEDKSKVDVKGKGKAVEHVVEDVKGKGKAVMGFQEGGASDDDGLY